MFSATHKSDAPMVQSMKSLPAMVKWSSVDSRCAVMLSITLRPSPWSRVCAATQVVLSIKRSLSSS